jgi:ribokinase
VAPSRASTGSWRLADRTADVTPGVASIGGISIDAVETPDGEWAGGLLGGNAAYGAWGASLWVGSNQSHVIGVVGGDFPPPWLRALTDAGIDVGGVKMMDGLTTSVWGAAYVDGEHRSTAPPPADPLEPRLADDEPVLGEIGAFHCAPVQPPVLLHNLRRLRRHTATIVVDPGEESRDWSTVTAAEVLSQTDVYCPSLDDLPGDPSRDPRATAARLGAEGPATVVLKLGATGSLIWSAGESMLVPAARAGVVDPTGAGDSYCGAFTAALLRYDDPFVAGVLASATASVAVEHRGLLDCLAGHRREVRIRAFDVADRLGLHLPQLTDA